jgi:hypothetical protein
MPPTPMRIPKPFKRRLAKKTTEEQGAIARCVKKLRENPHQPGLRVSKMGGHADVFEVRIDRAKRLTFVWDGPVIVLLNHCDHDKVLKNPRGL